MGYKQAREIGEAAPRRYEFEALRGDGTTMIMENVVISVNCVNWGGQATILGAFIDVSELRRAVREAEQREREVMNMSIAGKANKVIAIDLGLSQRTVETHRANVMDKLQVGSLADLVRVVTRAGFA